MTGMKRMIAFFTAVLICLGFSGCKDNAEKEESINATNVTVFEVNREKINTSASYTGEIIGTETTIVSAQTSGTAKNIYVSEGDYVSEGELLLSIDSTTYQLAYNQALAAYKSAEASYNSVTGGSSKQSLSQLETNMNAAKIAYDNALDIYNKQKTLYDMGAISQVEFNSYKTNLDNSKLNYDSAKTNYELTKDVVVNESEQSAQAGVMQAKAALDIAQNNLKNCSVIAPISGYISSKNINRGQMAAAGVSLFTITDTSSVEVQINVTEAVISLISKETKATVDVGSANLQNIEGDVCNINPVKNPATGLYTVKISIPNEDGAIKAGMIAKLSLITEERENAVTVPTEALLKAEDESYYLYVAKGAKAEKRKVTVGISNDEYTEIVSGVKPGDKVVLKGKEYLSDDNLEIKIVTEQGE